jgi:hypothetical protein
MVAAVYPLPMGIIAVPITSPASRLRRPLLFDAIDGKPVSDILALPVPKRAAEEHLGLYGFFIPDPPVFPES